MEPILRVDGVSKKFGGLMALSDVSFDVARGRILGLIGPNGAGKTTMFNCVAGLYRPTEGTIVFRPGARDQQVQGEKPEKMTALGVARTFHGHHHDQLDYSADRARLGFNAFGVGFRGIVDQDGQPRTEDVIWKSVFGKSPGTI